MSGADGAGGIIDSLEVNHDIVAPDINLKPRTKMAGRVFGWLDPAHGSANRQRHLGQKQEKDRTTLKMATEEKPENVMICVKGEFGEKEEEGRRQGSPKQQKSNNNSSRETIEIERRQHRQLQRQVLTEERGREKEKKDGTEHEESVLPEAGHEERENGGDSGDLPEIVRIRQRNIARNQAMMATLSLPQASTEMLPDHVMFPAVKRFRR